MICVRENEDDPEGVWRIVLLELLVAPVIQWYHQVLGHYSSMRLYNTIASCFYFTGLKRYCDMYQCEDCQKNKQIGPGYGMLPPRQAILMLWDEVHVDLIRLWKVKVGRVNFEFNALTCINPVANLVEIICINNKTSEHVAQ